MNPLQEAELNILKYFDAFTKKNGIPYTLYAGTLLGAVRHEGFIPWDDDIDVGMKRADFEQFEKQFIQSDYEEEGFIYQSRKIYPFQALPLSKIRSREIDMVERMPSTQKGNYGPWIDIFPFDQIPNDLVKRVEQYEKVSFYNELIKKFLLVQVEPVDTGIKKMAKKLVQSSNEKFYQAYFFLPYLFKKRHEWMTKYNGTDTSHSADLAHMHYRSYEEYATTIFKTSDLDQLTEGKFEDQYYPIPKNYDEILTTLYGNYMELPKKADRKQHKIEYTINS